MSISHCEAGTVKDEQDGSLNREIVMSISSLSDAEQVFFERIPAQVHYTDIYGADIMGFFALKED